MKHSKRAKLHELKAGQCFTLRSPEYGFDQGRLVFLSELLKTFAYIVVHQHNGMTIAQNNKGVIIEMPHDVFRQVYFVGWAGFRRQEIVHRIDPGLDVVETPG